MADKLYVNKPGGVIVHMKDGTSKSLTYGDPIPDGDEPSEQVADYVNIKTFADKTKRKPDAEEIQIQEAHRRAALSENGQVNSSSSPVPGNYSELDEDAASQLVSNLAAYPEQQASVVQHELLNENRQKVIDAAGDYAKAAAGVRNDALSENTLDNQGEALLEQPPVVAPPDPYTRPEGLTPEQEKEAVAALEAAGTQTPAPSGAGDGS